LQLDSPLAAQSQGKPDSPAPKEATVNMPQNMDEQDAKIPPDQLDSLVAPIALYPDPMLAQVLAASTYPLELIQLQQWLAKNKNLKDKALVDAVSKQPWDPSIQGLAALPEVVKRLAEDIQWTTDLGNAFLAQQSDVMEAIQRMRKKATEAGNLKSTEQQKVETKVVESKQVIVIEQSNPEVVYVPSRDERTPRMQELSERLHEEGRRPYVIPIGASTPLGALAFVLALLELVDQMPAPDVIVHSTSSGVHKRCSIYTGKKLNCGPRP
jgi:hypothetical protein